MSEEMLVLLAFLAMDLTFNLVDFWLRWRHKL